MQRKSTNPFAYKAKAGAKKSAAGKRVGKSKPGKANNQRNRILSSAKGSYTIANGRFIAKEQ